MQDCNVEEETMRKQVSGRISFLVRAVELGRGTKAKPAGALVLASPVGVISAAQCLCLWQCNWNMTFCKVALGNDSLALPEVYVLITL